jgi:hypothetical protein
MNFGTKDRVNKTLGITVELKIMSQATNFIKQILFLARGRNSTGKTLNQTSLHMQWMVRFVVEISASVGGFPLDFSGQCHLFPDENSQERNRSV